MQKHVDGLEPIIELILQPALRSATLTLRIKLQNSKPTVAGYRISFDDAEKIRHQNDI